MASRAQIPNIEGPRLNPVRIRLLLTGCLPEESRPTPDVIQLSIVLSDIKTYGLLDEQVHDPSDAKLVGEWRNAMDAWTERVISLASSKMPDKCSVGLSLLGVSCGECSSDRFMASYSVWFQKILSIIQLPSSTSFVRMAACAALSDLFTRLADFSNLKKDGIAFAGKVILPIIELLNENGSNEVVVLELLCTILMFFPSLHRHYDNVQAALVSKIVSSRYNANLSKKIANCLALLPRAKGDEDTWSLMMQKIIIEIDILLNDPLQTLEGETKGSSVVRLLVPPGKDPPSELGIRSLLRDVTYQPTKRFRYLVVPVVDTLIKCCCMMLTRPYTSQVKVPIAPLLALIHKVLMVDDSSHESLTQFTTVLNQELVFYQFPALRLSCLDLLIALIKGVRSQLIPHGAAVARILTQYSRKATVPSLRIKLYSAMGFLLRSMGVGMSLYLAQDLVSNASADLNDHPGINTHISNQQLSGEPDQAITQSRLRKRKHFSESATQLPDGSHKQSVVISLKPSAPLSVKTAALEALQALLTMGGSLRSECWRSGVDHLLITVAKNACDMGWACGGKSSVRKTESTDSLVAFQLAALRALLASLLSASHARPPHLSEGLEIFRRGKLETGTKLAACCQDALLSLEALIHPRALPLIHTEDSRNSTLKACNQRYQGNTFYGHLNLNTAIFPTVDVGATNGMDDDNGDEVLNGWLRGDNEEERPVQLSHTPITKEDAVGLNKDHEFRLNNGESSRINIDGPSNVGDINVQTIVAAETDKASNEDDIAAYVAQTNEGETENNNLKISGTTNGEYPSSSGAPVKVGTISDETMTAVSVVDGKQLQIGTFSNENTSVPNVYQGTDVPDKRIEPAPMYDSDSVSLDSLPGIVDVDPDTD
ncbi:uncharacterized protein LOC122015805 [Zingiber officinale]|uniref:Pre-rRNA-processing protein RIX1 N-terminal domain-containing protein n=1 Tax=Zingiber officinale TaxID=94328 RepID=A0A8J5F7U0_ZINOF|nr:uncharacterized protein LOC122015805 [Zingiber officinale]KAG6483146.1 hypothetical protein ZIOFF_059786 [Zingiber officinale]